MKIMHYFLGFPPYRSGGLTKFAYDLMLTQVQQGEDVLALWPGQIRVLSDKVDVKLRPSVNGIKNYEIINPLPVPYDEGVTDIKAFTKQVEKIAYRNLLERESPDVIHIHTLMGLHKEFVEVAKEKNIKIVFSTHDFFPICPKVTMYKDGEICNCDTEECPNCNLSALSIKKIVVLQSPLYRILKENYFLKKLRARHRREFFSEQKNNNFDTKFTASSCDYIKLRKYYSSILNLIDTVHFNSSISKYVYERFFSIKNDVIIPITHGDIRNRKKKKQFETTLKISYLGPGGGAKGFFLLKEALDELWEKKNNFVLNIYFTPKEPSQYMNIHNPYTYSELEQVFDNTDVLIVPSIWNETFGYTVLEALSYGTPVIVSPTVGAKDIIASGCGIVLHSISKQQIIQELGGLTKHKLETMNTNILHNQRILEIDEMSSLIKAECY